MPPWNLLQLWFAGDVAKHHTTLHLLLEKVGAGCRQHRGVGFCHSIHDTDACVHFGGCAAGPHLSGAQLRHAVDLTARTNIIFDLSYFRGFELTAGATMHAFDMLTSFDMISRQLVGLDRCMKVHGVCVLHN